MNSTVSAQLLDLLACPKCRAALRQAADELECVNPGCGLSFPVREGIPILLIEEARGPTPPAPKPSRESGA